VVATLEPVLAAVFAWVIHGEALSPGQIAGGLLVVAAVVWVQLQRISHDMEAAPEQTSRKRMESEAARV
jgi:drug/metabolite transporter (DMT)-like permease